MHCLCRTFGRVSAGQRAQNGKVKPGIGGLGRVDAAGSGCKLQQDAAIPERCQIGYDLRRSRVYYGVEAVQDLARTVGRKGWAAELGSQCPCLGVH